MKNRNRSIIIIYLLFFLSVMQLKSFHKLEIKEIEFEKNSYKYLDTCKINFNHNKLFNLNKHNLFDSAEIVYPLNPKQVTSRLQLDSTYECSVAIFLYSLRYSLYNFFFSSDQILTSHGYRLIRTLTPIDTAISYKSIKSFERYLRFYSYKEKDILVEYIYSDNKMNDTMLWIISRDSMDMHAYDRRVRRFVQVSVEDGNFVAVESLVHDTLRRWYKIVINSMDEILLTVSPRKNIYKYNSDMKLIEVKKDGQNNLECYYHNENLEYMNDASFPPMKYKYDYIGNNIIIRYTLNEKNNKQNLSKMSAVYVITDTGILEIYTYGNDQVVDAEYYE